VCGLYVNLELQFLFCRVFAFLLRASHASSKESTSCPPVVFFFYAPPNLSLRILPLFCTLVIYTTCWCRIFSLQSICGIFSMIMLCRSPAGADEHALLKSVRFTNTLRSPAPHEY